MSAYTNLMGVVEAGKNDYEAAHLDERGRGFASAPEAWAELKKQMELLASGTKDTEKAHKEMWDAVKEQNEDAFSALAGQMSRAAVQLAAEWIRAAALAEWAI